MKKIYGFIVIIMTALFLVSCNTEDTKVTVTFDTNGGTPSIESVEYQIGDLVVIPEEEITKDGFDFEYWADGTKEWNFNETKLTEDLTLIAIWKSTEDVEQDMVTITFDSNGGTSIYNLEIIKGSKLTLPANPIKDGFEFTGWLLNGVNFNSNDSINNNITLVASWVELVEQVSELLHKVDTSTLPANETSYVTSPTDFDLLDSVTNTNISFTRLNANISIPTNMTNRAVVLGIRSGNNWESAYLQNTNAINDITSIKLDYSIWGSGQYQNLDYTKGIYVQSSIDGNTWVNEVDLKSKIEATDLFTSVEEVKFSSPAKYVRILVESAGAQTGNYQMRLIVNGLEIYTSSSTSAPVVTKVVTFDSNHSNLTPINVSVNEGRLVDTKLPIERPNHKFLGWFNEDVLFDFNQTIVEDITLVAKWELIDDSTPVDPTEPVETELELTHEYLFNEFPLDQSYVSVPTNIDINNELEATKVGFKRLNTAFNGYNGTSGAVLAIRNKNGYESAYLKTLAPIEGLSSIEFNYTVWGNTDQQNLSHAEGIYIETSTDGINWTIQKDIKDEIKNVTAFSGIASIDGLSGDLYVRIHAKKSGTASQYDMRIIIEELRFYINGEPFTGNTYQATLDYGYEGSSNPIIINVREGKTLSVPTNPSRLGYTFLGWYEVGTTTQFDFNQTINGNVRLIAKWEVREVGENPSEGNADIESYYVRLNGLNGTSLVNELTNIIKTTGRATGSTAEVKQADTYQGQNYNIYTGFGSYGNREHVWPNSKLGSAPDYDLHNLRAAVISVNSARSNYPYMEGSGSWKSSGGAFYPGDEHVGDVARIVLYISTRYNLNLNLVGNKDMFLRWHQLDPVSDFERVRNNNIQKIQSNRNPFIDYPEYVEVLFGSPTNRSVSVETVYNIEYNIPVINYTTLITNNKRQYIA